MKSKAQGIWARIKAWLVTLRDGSSGASFYLDAPRPQGFLIRTLPSVVAGWGFFSDQPARFVEIRLNGRVLEIQPLSEPRPDVLTQFPQTRAFQAPLGFDLRIVLPPDFPPGPHWLEVCLIGDHGRRQQVAKVPVVVGEIDPQSDFSKRFAMVPTPLLIKVNGSNVMDSFLKIGEEVAKVLRTQMGEGLSQKAPKVLDFGCGLGRVLGPLTRDLPNARFTGFDIDPAMLAWGRMLNPQLNNEFILSTSHLPDGSFDILYAISVFTHLDQQSDYWLGEVARLLATGGQALLTYHDETLFREKLGHLLDQGRLPFTDHYVFGKGAPEGETAMGTFYTTEAWVKKLNSFFQVERTVPRGLFGEQSFSIVKRREAVPSVPEAVRQYIHGLEMKERTL